VSPDLNPGRLLGRGAGRIKRDRRRLPDHKVRCKTRRPGAALPDHPSRRKDEAAVRDAIIGQLGRYRYFCGSELDDRFVSGLDEANSETKRTVSQLGSQAIEII
jgi:hypothetical protein